MFGRPVVHVGFNFVPELKLGLKDRERIQQTTYMEDSARHGF